MYLKKKSRHKNQQNLKKILKHSSKPCGIEKWVFQSTRLNHTKAPPKVKHTGIPQKSSIRSWQLENIKSLQKTPTKSKNNIKTLEQTPVVLKSRLSNLPDGSVPKAPPKLKHTGITQKSPIWSWQLENIKSLQKNPTKSKTNIKTFEQTLQY